MTTAGQFGRGQVGLVRQKLTRAGLPMPSFDSAAYRNPFATTLPLAHDSTERIRVQFGSWLPRTISRMNLRREPRCLPYRGRCHCSFGALAAFCSQAAFYLYVESLP